MKVTIKDMTYSYLSLDIGKHNIKIENGSNCFTFRFNDQYYWAGSSNSARHFLEVLKNDDSRFISLLKMSGILGYARRMRAMENLLRDYGDVDKEPRSINIFAQTIKACYLSICITQSFHDYKIVNPEVKKLKRYLKDDVESMKWLNFFEKLDMKFIVNTIAKE